MIRTIPLLVLLSQTPSVQSPPAAALGLIAGRVVDGVTGRPVSGVVVTLVARPAPDGPTTRPAAGAIGGAAAAPQRLLVDGEGRFLFATLPGGAFDLSAAKRGYVSGAPGKLRADGAGQTLTLADQERRTDVTIRVWKHAAITGVVVDEMNEPVVGVSVYAFKREWIAGEPRFRSVTGSSATTDDRGAFRLGSLVAGEYLVSVPSTQNTVPAASLEAIAAGATASQDLRNAVGRVAGQPQALGHRDALRVGDFVLHGTIFSVIPPPPAADGRLSVYPTVFHPGPPTGTHAALVPVAFGETRMLPPIQLRPSPAVTVSGVVTGTDPSTTTTLTLIPQGTDGFASESGLQAARTMAAAGGAFTFLGVTPGTYHLRATTWTSPPPPPGLAAPGYVPSTAPAWWAHDVIVVGNRDTTVSVTMRPGLTISGELRFEGQRTPPPQAQIARNVIGLGYADGRSITSLTGRDLGGTDQRFRIAEVAGGSYTLRILVTPPGWALKSITVRGQDAIDAPIEVMDDVADIVVTFTDRPTSVRGTVRTAAGTADSEAVVVVFPAARERWSASGRSPFRMRTSRADATGAFTIGHLPPGDYLIAAIHDSVASGWTDPRFLDAISRQATRVRIDDGASLTQDLRRVEVK